MLGVIIILIFLSIFSLKSYTKHDESVKVPVIKGFQVEDAAGILRAHDLTYQIVDSSYTFNGVPGAIIEQKPSGNSKVKKGRVVYLVVKAKGIQQISIPSFKDYSVRQALAHLTALGFPNLVVSEVASQYKGLVIRIEYNGRELKAGEKIPKGSTLCVVVGAGGDIVEEADSLYESTSAQPGVD